MKKNAILYLLMVCSLLQSVAQNKPFPQKGKFAYAAGFTATNLSNDEVASFYQKWKSTYVNYCSNGDAWVRNDFGIGTAVSEGIAYGMLIAVYMNDKDLFDKLFRFHNSHLDNYGLMNWNAPCGAPYYSTNPPGPFEGFSSASDADEDVATALILAHEQWGENYLPAAINQLRLIKNLLLKPYNQQQVGWLLKAGDYDTRNAPFSVNTSYLTPAWYRLWAQYDIERKDVWNQLANDALTILQRNSDKNGPYGISSRESFPDGSKPVCTSSGDQTFGSNCVYQYDACRNPWRVAADYYWYGTAQSKAWCEKITNWVDNIVGIANLKSTYGTDGTPLQFDHNIPFVGGFACGAMCVSQDRTDRFTQEIKNINQEWYYSSTLKMLYYIMLSGNMWKPAGNSAYVAVSSVNIQPQQINLIVSNMQQLEAIVLPANASNKNVSWVTSNNVVAIVDNQGRLTAVAAGATTVSAITQDGNKIATASITVAPPSVSSTLIIRARGYLGTEKLALLVDGIIVKEFIISKTMSDYTYDAFQGQHNVKLLYTNDAASNGDIIIDYIKLDNAVKQAEDQTVNTGAWNGSQNKCGGISSERLDCGGFIDFGTVGKIANFNTPIVIRASGSVGNEVIALLIDDVVVKEFTLTKTPADYEWLVVNGNRNIKVKFMNDAGARDANIDYVKIGNTIYQAEDQAINTGVWNGAQNKCGGLKSERLDCGGYIDFGNRLLSGATATRISINEYVSDEQDIQVYPNPSKDKTFIQFSVDISQPVVIIITDIAGKIVKQISYRAEAGINQLQVKVPDKAGVYMLQIVKDGKSEVKKLVVR
jgi:endoglucanase